MSHGIELTKQNLHLILGLEWQIEHRGNRTYLTRNDYPRADNPVGVIIIDWAWRAIICANKNSPDIDARIQTQAQQEYFDAMRLVEAEASAISDIIRPSRGYEDLNSLFEALYNLRADGRSPASVFAFASHGFSGKQEYHYALIEFDEKTGFQTHMELSSAVQDLESAKRMQDDLGIKKAKNKIDFIVKNSGIYHQVIEIALLRDSHGFTWDESASFLTEAQLESYGDDTVLGHFGCIEPNCSFKSHPESWQLGYHGGFVAACYRAWEYHKEAQPFCDGPINF